ncbi:hypothetical protein AAT19DRAFT_16249 [Rhodotorula toruloides]|uniref:Uncharacterized protein n=1 Tax=Rhodotorula toruloides TaxID=5286 RepID=A0A2T0A6F8_RHOTO|nr:hypothetical protein AAT19DRAFT_16249 [Rhodotorula toruloides]
MTSSRSQTTTSTSGCRCTPPKAPTQSHSRRLRETTALPPPPRANLPYHQTNGTAASQHTSTRSTGALRAEHDLRMRDFHIALVLLAFSSSAGEATADSDPPSSSLQARARPQNSRRALALAGTRLAALPPAHSRRVASLARLVVLHLHLLRPSPRVSLARQRHASQLILAGRAVPSQTPLSASRLSSS